MITNHSANSIANDLVQSKLAACVNIIPQIISIYHWKGEIVQENEFCMLIKTKCENVSTLIERIKNIHPYSIPEVISIQVNDGNKDYFKWVQDSTSTKSN